MPWCESIWKVISGHLKWLINFLKDMRVWSGVIPIDMIYYCYMQKGIEYDTEMLYRK